MKPEYFYLLLCTIFVLIVLGKSTNRYPLGNPFIDDAMLPHSPNSHLGIDMMQQSRQTEAWLRLMYRKELTKRLVATFVFVLVLVALFK